MKENVNTQALIDKLQADINGLYKTLSEAQNQIEAERIRRKILTLYEKLYMLNTQPKEVTKVCPVCKKEFIASNGKSVCCSMKCYNHYYYLQKTIAKRAKLRANRPLKEITCKECGKTFLAENTRYKFCSEECRKAHAKKYMAKYKEVNRDKILESQAKYRKTEKYKITREKYRNSEKGKATIRKRQQTEKYKAFLKEYRKSEKYKKAMKKYRNSEKGKAARKRYIQSEKYKEVQKRYHEKKKIESNLES